MLHSLSEGPFTYTTARVEQILEDDLDRADPNLPDKIAQFTVNAIGFRLEQKEGKLVHHFPTPESHQAHAASLCSLLIDSIEDPTRHVELMDEAFSSLVTCHFRPTRPTQETAEEVCALLSRLPATPLEITDTSLSSSLSMIPGEFFLPGRGKGWETLRLVRHVTRNIIRVPLCWSIMPRALTSVARLIHDLSETVAELFDFCIRAPESSKAILPWKSFLLKAFLWTQWQRCVILNSWFILNSQIQQGFNTELSSEILVSRMTSGLVQAFDGLAGTSKIRVVHPEPIPYVCKWALRLLQTDRASISFDLRRLFHRYAQLFAQLPPRCIKLEDGSMAQCAGDSLYKCNRFVGMKIEDQTAHTKQCAGKCQSLHWNEESYRDTEGARAVSLHQKDSGLLQYCTASDRTMAISHVWSHGQGGRPELGTSGLNSCLHDRYVKIAKSNGCDSYWMDTPCIPQDSILRREAIEQINSVFANSKFTLVCDRDLMSIHVDNLSLDLQESILACILLCDWNVRAWTLLEALRGRKNIHILCADDEITPLKDVLYTVQREGSVDLAILYLTAQHLLPAYLSPPGMALHKDWHRNETEPNGILQIEQAAGLMHLRHASRRGDEIVIWSLLCNDKVPKPFRRTSHPEALHGVGGDDEGVEEIAEESLDEDPNQSLAEAFWRMRVGQIIHTGFLMSSAPRNIKRKGLTWAPSRPALPPLAPEELEMDMALPRESYMPFDGRETMPGIIFPWGYRAQWLVHMFKNNVRKSSSSQPKYVQTTVLTKSGKHVQGRLNLISASFLQEDWWGALLQPLTEMGYPARYRGQTTGTLVAIVGSRDLSAWKWRGLYSWDSSLPLPDLEEEQLVLE